MADHTIIFYDLMRQGPEEWLNSERSWSPNTLNMALNIKGLPYETEWLKFAEIAPKMKSLGIQPTQAGPIAYTLPAIVDKSPSGEQAIADSFAIAQYLDSAYPTTPSLIPAGTAALQLAYIENIVDPFMRAAYAGLCQPSIGEGCIDDADRAYYRLTREALFGGTSLEDIMTMMDGAVEGSCKVFREMFDEMARNAKTASKEGLFIGGERPWHVDTAVVAVLMSTVKVCGRNHPLSKVILEHEWASRSLEVFSQWA